MTFKQRSLQIQFTDNNGNAVDLSGYRALAVIDNPGGYSAYGSLELKIFGMSLATMDEYSSTGFDQVNLQNKSVTVSAGDVGGAIAQVFKGTIVRARIEFNQPEAAFCVSAIAGFYEKGISAAANSYQGSQNAEDLIAALASSIGFEFVNKNGAHAVLQNQYLYGSAIDQINSISRACNLPVVIENNQVIIFPNNGVRDDIVIELSPQNGMVGYPKYWEAGFIVESEFNPLIANGRTIKVSSEIPKSNGSWPVQAVTHVLSSEILGDGPWFTIAKLSPSSYVSNN